MYEDVLIAGYSDRLSVRPGETIRFAVSSLAETNYQATLFRSISSDPNPEGPGMVELNADCVPLSRDYWFFRCNDLHTTKVQ